MRASGYLVGQNYVRRYKLGASGTFATPGIPAIMAATNGNVTVCSTTAAADALGLAVGTGTYITTTNSANLPEATIEVDINPFCILEATMSGGATEGTALTVLTNTSGETNGTVLTATIQSNDIDGGTLWRYQNGNGAQTRTITTHTSTTSLTVTVPFQQDIALGDTFLVCPWNETGTGAGGNDGSAQIQVTTNLYQADATSASGTGIKAQVVELILRGTTNSAVRFLLNDHVFNGATTT